MCIHTFACMHACMHACTRACVDVFVHACLRACVRACVRVLTCLCVRVCACVCFVCASACLTCVMYIHTYIHIYIYTYIHIYMYTQIHMYMYAYTNVHVYRYTYIPKFIYIYIYVYTYIDTCRECDGISVSHDMPRVLLTHNSNHRNVWALANYNKHRVWNCIEALENLDRCQCQPIATTIECGWAMAHKTNTKKSCMGVDPRAHLTNHRVCTCIDPQKQCRIWINIYQQQKHCVVWKDPVQGQHS